MSPCLGPVVDSGGGGGGGGDGGVVEAAVTVAGVLAGLGNSRSSGPGSWPTPEE